MLVHFITLIRYIKKCMQNIKIWIFLNYQIKMLFVYLKQWKKKTKLNTWYQVPTYHCEFTTQSQNQTGYFVPNFRAKNIPQWRGLSLNKSIN